MMGWFKGLADTIGNVSGAIGNATGSFTRTVSDTIGNVSGAIGNATGSFTRTVSDTIGNVSGAIGNATKGILPTTITEKKSEEVVQKVTAPYKDLSRTVGEIGSKSLELVKGATDKVGDLSGGVADAFKGVTDWVGNTSGAIGNFTGKYGKYIPIAAAAVGGLVLLSVLKK